MYSRRYVSLASLSFTSQVLVIIVKDYIKADLKVFWSFLDLLFLIFTKYLFKIVAN